MSFISTRIARSSLHQLGAQRQVLRTSQTAVRMLSKSAVVRDAEYEKHRIQANPPTMGTTKDMSQPMPKTDLTEPQSKPSQSLPLFSMAGKVCVVTGGARGIGQMICRAFLEAECTQLAILDLKKEDAEATARELVQAFEEQGRPKGSIRAIGLGVNIADETSVQAGFKSVMEEFGQVDSVVNSAGIVENFTAEAYPTDRLKMLCDINIMGSFYVARESAKVMKPGSSIVMIGSMSGVVINVPQPQTPYNFSKAAVIHMVKSLAVEWAPKGIRVNAVSPGYVLTNLTKVILDKPENQALKDEWINRYVEFRPADPNDLKGPVLFLASDAGSYTTGSNMIVDGGYTCI
ncbi:hypothetical protein FFLO_00969 [Filobasidium floriforme]|uniref:D-arabinitol 2-dehydrogenase n=1 Tax=Filobasidium floriforme TaxID=5210 RepID=A0A8K0JRK6_9TREE|nr:hypothetical protein FFLO_00969 [Filobasidium floriforme]